MAGEGSTDCENGHNSEREDVNAGVVFRLFSKDLWSRVRQRLRSRCHGGCSNMRHDTRHAEICDLCHHLRVQENVSGRQVAVDDGRRSPVQVGQAARHVVQHGALENHGEEG